MARYVGIRFNDEEEQRLLKSFSGSEEDGLSTHIKQVFFAALEPNTKVLTSIHTDLAQITTLLQTLKPTDGSHTDQSLLLSIVCATYLMIRKSVSESIRAQSDTVLDVTAIEKYLRGN